MSPKVFQRSRLYPFTMRTLIYRQCQQELETDERTETDMKIAPVTIEPSKMVIRDMIRLRLVTSKERLLPKKSDEA